MTLARDFLRNGHLGELAVGVSVTAVIDLLGEAEALAGPRKQPSIRILRYDSLQISLVDGIVNSLGLYFSNGFAVPHEVAFRDWKPVVPITEKEMLTACAAWGLPVQQVFTADRESHFYRPVEGGAALLFEDSRSLDSAEEPPGHSFILHSIQYPGTL